MTENLQTGCSQEKEIAGNGQLAELAVCLTAGSQAREWPVAKYAQTVLRLSSVFPLEVVLVGGNDGRAVRSASEFAKILDGKVHIINLQGETSLREMTAVLAKCDYYLGNDTGPTHIAAVAGLSGVAIVMNDIRWDREGVHTAERFGPYKSGIKTICPAKPLPGCENGCVANYPHCIDTISVDDVVKVFLQSKNSEQRSRWSHVSYL